MPTNIQGVIRKMPAAQRKRVQARTTELIAEELTLKELRLARKLTQASIAKILGVGQDQVSKLEKRSDLLLSTLREYVKAMGGTLSLVAMFPDRKPVVLSGISMPELEAAEQRRLHQAASASIGIFAGRGSRRAENSRQVIRERLKQRNAH